MASMATARMGLFVFTQSRQGVCIANEKERRAKIEVGICCHMCQARTERWHIEVIRLLSCFNVKTTKLPEKER